MATIVSSRAVGIANRMSIAQSISSMGATGLAPDASIPSLALDFTTGSLDSRITFSRSTEATPRATYFGSDGLLKVADVGAPRFDYDPVTLTPKGLLIEESRTNLLLNSTINGANLATQNITTTAAARTLSFYGAGTIVLSGTHSATVVGTGAFPTRTTYTYTPTAGTLTLTVSGTVQYAQDELGSFATSYIVTDGSTKTRAADSVSMTGTNFSSWWNATEGTFVVANDTNIPTSSAAVIVAASAANITDQLYFRVNSSSAGRAVSMVASSATANMDIAGTSVSTPMKRAFAYKQDDFAASANGGAVVTDTLGNIPTVNQLIIGNRYDQSTSTNINGHISRLIYFPKRLPDATLKVLTA